MFTTLRKPIALHLDFDKIEESANAFDMTNPRYLQAYEASKDESPFFELGTTLGLIAKATSYLFAADAGLPFGGTINDFLSGDLLVFGEKGTYKSTSLINVIISHLFSAIVKPVRRILETNPINNLGMVFMDGKGAGPSDVSAMLDIRLNPKEVPKFNPIEGLDFQEVVKTIYDLNNSASATATASSDASAYFAKEAYTMLYYTSAIWDLLNKIYLAKEESFQGDKSAIKQYKDETIKKFNLEVEFHTKKNELKQLIQFEKDPIENAKLKTELTNLEASYMPCDEVVCEWNYYTGFTIFNNAINPAYYPIYLRIISKYYDEQIEQNQGFTLEEKIEFLQENKDDLNLSNDEYVEMFNEYTEKLSEKTIIDAALFNCKKYSEQFSSETTQNIYNTGRSWMNVLMLNKDLVGWCVTTKSQFNPIKRVLMGETCGVDLPSVKYGPAGQMCMSFFKAQLYSAIIERALDTEKHYLKRGEKNVLLLVDECQSIINQSDLDMIPIARSLGLMIVMCTQIYENLETQLGPEMAAAFFNNFSNYITFRTSPKTRDKLLAKLGKTRRFITLSKKKVSFDYEKTAIQEMLSPLYDNDNPYQKELTRFARSHEAVGRYNQQYMAGDSGARKGLLLNLFNLNKDKHILSSMIPPVQRAMDKEETNIITEAEWNNYLQTKGQAIALFFNRAGSTRIDVIRCNPIVLEKMETPQNGYTHHWKDISSLTALTKNLSEAEIAKLKAVSITPVSEVDTL